jgi:hypothetical protein
MKMTRTFQFHGDDVLTDAVVAAGIASNAPLGIGVRHGWRRVGEPMLVTASADNRVYTLDDRPALDIYLEQLGLDEPADRDQEGLARLALTHPLGLAQAARSRCASSVVATSPSGRSRASRRFRRARSS